jgi:hypothetical protein
VQFSERQVAEGVPHAPPVVGMQELHRPVRLGEEGHSKSPYSITVTGASAGPSVWSLGFKVTARDEAWTEFIASSLQSSAETGDHDPRSALLWRGVSRAAAAAVSTPAPGR